MGAPLLPGESRKLLELLFFSVLACVLAGVAFEQLVLLYGREAEARLAQITEYSGAGATTDPGSHMGQVQRRHQLAREEGKHYATLAEQVEKRSARLQASQASSWLVATLERIGRDAGCPIATVTIDRSPVIGGGNDLDSVSLTLSASGTYVGVRRLVHQLETDPTTRASCPFRVRELSLTPSSTGPNQVQASITVACLARRLPGAKR